jgi:hypothetical protein
MTTPTNTAYTELQTAYDFFNGRIFGGELPACLITMQRKKSTYGYYCKERFINIANLTGVDLRNELSHPQDAARTDEIAMNPEHMARPVAEVLSTLVHEMCHLWQFNCTPKPPKSAYHNKEWAEKMKQCGLHPSDTGQPGGKETGFKMTHYIVAGGIFEIACNELLATGFGISWADGSRKSAAAVKKARAKNKITYIHTCAYDNGAEPLKVWGKPGLHLTCPCGGAYVQESAGEPEGDDNE